ncbi:putative HAT dimerization domain, ribonuclease H-like domain-containing protein [Rosa chinensis]|uniref:Putative HAT dimerization domain, ribonuclease H-like domain-containing protein n=1 Tax=Rosa chinensis TaxID=74649 RepID=A0A2P6QEJ3_ROSCH|nr:putative HAT dimerization domain, ribonuclease H-like domain-containing protein [Rosa chinensis]
MPTLEVADGFEFNLLGWWRSHEEVYPVLSLIARDLLSIPASTVASEAAFSAGGRVVSEKRASLNPDTIQALICLKDWKLAEARQQDKEQDELRAEEEQNAKLARPEWMIALERANSNTEGVESIGD